MSYEYMKKRYKGAQNILKNIGTDGCYFLCLCTIIEETNNDDADILEIARTAIENDWMDNEYWIKDACAILRHFTKRDFKKREMSELPAVVKDNEFTIEKWYNERTNLNHFKRRFVDTWNNSVTVKEGYIETYYFFWYD